MFSNLESLVIILLCGSIVTLACCCGLCVLLTGWRGKLAGIALGSIVLACGLVVLVLTTRTVARYWWISLPPMLFGIQSIRVWRQEQPIRGFRLSTLLLAIGFVGAMCAGVGQLYRQWQSERPLVSKIESLIKGEIEYDFDGIAIGLNLYEVEEGSLDEILSLLVQLRHIRRFQVGHCRISLKQAKQIGELADLQQLWLQSTDIDDDKIAQLGRLKKLTTLDLMDTQVTGSGLKHLEEAKRLRHIWLSTDKISLDDVEQLRSKLPRLEVSY